MKHGIAFRKLSRTTSHRMLMLRNLVTSLFEHEQIKTTLPKARETARMAEKIITLGKRGDQAAHARAAALLLNPELLPKLFGTFAKRYAQRPGGYTRIHKFGNRPGDNAPHAVLELVDNPRDIKWEITSRAVGWDLLRDKLKSKKPVAIINTGAEDTLDVITAERKLTFVESGVLRPQTRWNLQKVLKFRDQSSPLLLSQKAGDYMVRTV
ncbi:ribosomal protein L17 [Mycena metata]|uniref:Ribosomal protein L17 n=1 Tax=Mycena metata TaxID=1033252 RepID=A0AAD7KIK2_9AGAR|nr:ribosomal protein L17 [Mycena metata]